MSEQFPERELAMLDWVRQDSDRFLARFPQRAPTMPAVTISWEGLERQLTSLATTPERKSLVGPLLSATRKQAWCKPPELVLREILVIAGVLQDESFEPGQPEADCAGGAFPMT